MIVRFNDEIFEMGQMTRQELAGFGFRNTGYRLGLREIYANGDVRIAFDPVNNYFTKYRLRNRNRNA